MLRNIISNEIFLLFPKYQKKKKFYTTKQWNSLQKPANYYCTLIDIFVFLYIKTFTLGNLIYKDYKVLKFDLLYYFLLFQLYLLKVLNQ